MDIATNFDASKIFIHTGNKDLSKWADNIILKSNDYIKYSGAIAKDTHNNVA